MGMRRRIEEMIGVVGWRRDIGWGGWSVETWRNAVVGTVWEIDPLWLVSSRWISEVVKLFAERVDG